MSDLQTFLNLKFKALPNTKEIRQIKKEMYYDLLEKVDGLLQCGYSLNDANKKVMENFGDLNEIIEAYGLEDSKKILWIENISIKLILFANILPILLFVIFIVDISNIFRFNGIFYRINDRINLSRPYTAEKIYNIVLYLLNIFYMIVGWFGFILYKKHKKLVSILFISLGVIVLIHGSIIGLLYLIAGLLYFTNLYSWFIKISLMINYIFLFIYLFRPHVFIKIINFVPHYHYGVLINNKYALLVNIFCVCYMLTLLLLTTFLITKKGHQLIDHGFYLMIMILIIHIMIGRNYFLFLGIPLLIIFILLKIQKRYS